MSAKDKMTIERTFTLPPQASRNAYDRCDETHQMLYAILQREFPSFKRTQPHQLPTKNIIGGRIGEDETLQIIVEANWKPYGIWSNRPSDADVTLTYTGTAGNQRKGINTLNRARAIIGQVYMRRGQ